MQEKNKIFNEMTLIDEIYDRMNDDAEIINRVVDLGESEIQKFFAGKTLFITGVTGFMGKSLVEKLLRSCSDLKHIYILIREKKGQSVNERIKKYFENEIFDVLKKFNPHYEEKVTAIHGDLISEKIGLSEQDQDRIQKETNIIIHNAGNVKFNARVSDLLKTNVLGTKNMLDLAERCQNLKVFLYISSAYSHSYKKTIREEFYTTPANLEMIYNMIETDTSTKEGLSDEATKMLIGDFMNTYTFSKAVAEELVRLRAEKVNFSCGVYRPSIVMSTYKEPIQGWIGNGNGPVWLFLASGLGLFHVGQFVFNPMDLIPCDMAINALIAITHDLPKRFVTEKKAVVYNYGSSVTNPTDIITLYNFIKNEGARGRSENAVWMNCLYYTEYFWFAVILHTIGHFIPAVIADFSLLLLSKKPRALSVFWRSTVNIRFLYNLANENWRIHMEETMKVIEKLNSADKEIFFSNPRNINWEEWMWTTWFGLRRFILKEDLNSKAGEYRYVMLWWAHYGLITVLCFIFTYLYAKMVYSLFQ